MIRAAVMFGYSLNYLMDMEGSVVVDVEATPTRISKEVDATETMLKRTAARFGLSPRRAAGDIAYGTGEMLGWLVNRGIELHISVWDRDRRDSISGRSDFRYDHTRDLYVCPAGHELTSSSRLQSDGYYRYTARKRDCDLCPLKPCCCPKQPERRIPRAADETTRDYVRGPRVRHALFAGSK